jgi:hypothetical protein
MPFSKLYVRINLSCIISKSFYAENAENEFLKNAFLLTILVLTGFEILKGEEFKKEQR